MPKNSSLYEDINEGHCTQIYPYICKGSIYYNDSQIYQPREKEFMLLKMWLKTKLIQRLLYHHVMALSELNYYKTEKQWASHNKN